MLEIKIHHLLKGAEEAEGLTVIVDVLRAGSVISTLLRNKAEHVVACGELAESYKLKEKGYILLGERNGIQPKDFDYPNSPSAIYGVDFTGKRVAVNTQAGSQAIVRAKNADEIIVSGFLNSKAVENYVKRQNPKRVSIVTVGYVDDLISEEAIEDEEYATFLKARLEGQNPDYGAIFTRIRHHPTIQRFFDQSEKKWPESDFHLCMTLNLYQCIPKVYKEGNLSVIRNVSRINNQDSF